MIIQRLKVWYVAVLDLHIYNGVDHGCESYKVSQNLKKGTVMINVQNTYYSCNGFPLNTCVYLKSYHFLDDMKKTFDVLSLLQMDTVICIPKRSNVYFKSVLDNKR